MPQPILLLTRPRDRSLRFLADLRAHLGREVEAVVSPLFSIVAEPDLPPLDGYAALILSSSGAVAALGARLKDREVRTVGARTAAEAAEAGARARCLGGSIAAFLERLDEVPTPAIHLHGRHVAGDLSGRAAARGVRLDAAVVYDQPACPPTPEALAALGGARPVIVPVFSPRSARLFAQIARSATAPVTVVAISPAAALAVPVSMTTRVADRPDADGMLRAVAALIG